MTLKIKISLLLFLLFTGIVACTKGKKDVSANAMYERSELATLMVDMWDENKKVKEDLVNGLDSVVLSGQHEKMFTAKPTDSSDLTPVFYNLAKGYNTLADSFSNAGSEREIKIKRYNAVIDGCVSCHENFCSGPIPKIKQLYLREKPSSL